MLAIHQRAAWIANEPDIPWHHFLRSRFIGRMPGVDPDATIAVVIGALAQQSEIHAEFRGIMEHASGSSLPVVVEITGTLHLDTREIAICESRSNRPGRKYSGQVSENGRVITLRMDIEGGKASKPFYLIHEETLARLSGD